MSKQTVALAYTRPAGAIAESEYQALAEALSESARGRAFLAEHARRSRSAENNILLTAIERIEAQVRPRQPEREPLYDELRCVLDDIRTARERIEAGGRVPKAEQLNALLDILQRRIGKLLPLPPAANIPPVAAPEAAAAPPRQRPSAAHWLDSLPEPSLADNDLGPPPAPPATPAKSGGNAQASPPAAEREPAVAAAFEIEDEIQSVVAAELQARAKNPFAPPAAKPVAATTIVSAEDALAAIMALSEEERIALFS